MQSCKAPGGGPQGYEDLDTSAFDEIEMCLTSPCPAEAMAILKAHSLTKMAATPPYLYKSVAL